MATPKEVIERIREIAPAISGEPLAGALHVPEASATPTQCFSNAERKAQQAGGGVLYGWMFQARKLTALPSRGCILAVNHAVWHAPDKKLIDVTPFHPDPSHHPLVLNGNTVLFLIDRTAAPLTTDHLGLALPSWFFPLTNDGPEAAHVGELARKELLEWERQVAAADKLKGSRRAADLLRSRREKAETEGPE